MEHDAQLIQRLVIDTLHQRGSIEDASKVVTGEGKAIDPSALVGVLKSLEYREMITVQAREEERLVLTEEGREIAEKGSHEAKVFALLGQAVEGLRISEIDAALGPEVGKIGRGKAFASKWIKQLDPERVGRACEGIVDQTQIELRQVQAGQAIPPAVAKELKRRKLVETVKHSLYSVGKGVAFSLDLTRQATDLTWEMVQTGKWQQAPFKAYNYQAAGLPPSGGHLHPLLKVREEFRQIFLEMGFAEMPTNQFAENSFWNFDTLFQPQQHPSRDAHDTFFLKTPATTEAAKLPAELLANTARVHSTGDYGSQGHRYDWQVGEALKNILRTHTTAITSRMLHRHSQAAGEFKPMKLFSIDRVFRNETLDATHLAEFHQIEGVIADRNLRLGDLIGVLEEFFRRLGMTRLRFKPAFNPYTEPSMEIFAYHPGLAKWIEVGNSGVFRPEMMKPYGFPDDVVAIAWGLSLERPTMIKYGISNIRDLVGHKVDLAVVQQNPICRLDK